MASITLKWGTLKGWSVGDCPTAKAALHARRADPEVKAGKKAVVDKHASRRVSGSLKRKTARQEAASVTPPSTQMGFDF